jgi:hypothetical protein
MTIHITVKPVDCLRIVICYSTGEGRHFTTCCIHVMIKYKQYKFLVLISLKFLHSALELDY